MTSSPRRVAPTLVAGGVLVALVAVLLVWQRPWAGGDEGAPSGGGDLESRLRAQLTASSDASDASAWSAGFGPGGRELGQASWAARQALGVDDVTMTLVSLGDAPDRGDGTRSAVVRVRWTSADDALLGRADEATATVVARVRAADGADESAGVDVLGVEASTGTTTPDPLPLWLAGEVTVAGTPEVALVTVGGDGPGVPEAAALTATAQTRVSALVGATGRSAVIVPANEQTASALLGRGPAGLGAVAGVTTRLPGSSDPVVVLNPAEFERMDARGRQIVVTHELTHAMTDAISTSAETWLVEGFADWVALHDDTAPLTTSAGAALFAVTQSGPPAALPTSDDLAGAGSAAAYQGAWLAVDVLGREHGGDAAVLQVYAAALGGTPIDQALAGVGTSVAELTQQWRDYLTYSASTVS
ncbi:hypothetical protein [Aeromicrobium alkaliterrae]|uniref:Peptidase MA-like domain-containing protein n=1 Tax=Aeromicrobium alkaliterrae TaxID=302168 RepID=A0ABP4VUS7_9ACTN